MSNTTDRELLEFAAKAAGLEIKTRFFEVGGWCAWRRHVISEGNEEWVLWIPLKHDGDAFRLAAMLCMETYHADDGGWAAYASHPTARGTAYAIERHGEDPCAATRRAIVRAAAEIGRKMK
jgi:hypothetical protein